MPKTFILLATALLAGCTSHAAQYTITEPTAPPLPRTSISREVQRQSIASQETLIPYSDVLTYSAEWPELTRRRVSSEQP